jgi:uncharacterized protein YdeI (YjbR/CyaY-like superfamily)
MEMAYRERWKAEIAELQRILSGFDLREECKWGKPCYTMDGKNVVIIQGFKEYCALGFFQGALLKDPKKLLVQLGQVQAARVMKFTSAKEIATKAATIKAYVREAVAAEKAGMKVETKPPEFPVPEELKEKFRNAVQARVRGADAGSAKGIPVSLRRREAVWDADRADREGDACDLRRTRVPGAAIDRETVDVPRDRLSAPRTDDPPHRAPMRGATVNREALEGWFR